LGAYVDPRTGGHLAVHREPQRLQSAEFFPSRPAGDQVGIGDKDPRCLLVGLEDAYRLAALNQQGLVILQPSESRDDLLIALPVPRRLPAPAVDDEFIRPLGYR